MKYLSIIFILLVCACTTGNNKQRTINIIPKPNQITLGKGVFKLSEVISLKISHESLRKIAENFRDETGSYISVKFENKEAGDIELSLIDSGFSEEEYQLSISKKRILIKAGSQKGIFYGLQSLKQLIFFANKEGKVRNLPCMSITDLPRFKWRGIMLDESRHFFGKEKVKQLLDIMALHKLNIFHWHLTDVPGWRIEIKTYPKLTTVGAMGNDMDENAPAKFYTQEEIKEVVKYAEERFIEVIPEIDMPGHAKAANRAYPEFSGGGSKTHPEFTFNPGYEGTYLYLTNILREVTTLFPSKYIHLGGDEVHYGNESWKTNKHVMELMKRENLKNLKEVERYFVLRMADSIKMLDKSVIAWDEVVDLNPDKENTVVMWWRHDKTDKLKNALENEFNVILCPRIPLYFDFDQDEAHISGRKWKGQFVPLDLVYHFPPDSLSGFKENENFVNGIQANIWTERIQNNIRLDYMTHPRLSAMAEAAWTNNGNKEWADFKIRLKPILEYFDNKGITYYNPFAPESTTEPEGVDKRKK